VISRRRTSKANFDPTKTPISHNIWLPGKSSNWDLIQAFEGSMLEQDRVGGLRKATCLLKTTKIVMEEAL